MLPISLTAVLVAAVVNFIIGFMMHGPVGGKLWMKLANIVPTGNEKFSGMVPQMVKNFIANLVFAYVLSAIYLFASSPLYINSGALNGVIVAFWVWFGFVVTSTSMDVIWMGKSAKLWMFEMFSSLLCILAMGAIIGAW